MPSLFKRTEVYPKTWQLLLLGLIFLSVGQHPIPVLDEESYWKIAAEMSWSRPYDWKMPWSPFEEQGFVYAHPPLFLYWVKLVQSFAGLSLAQWILGIPFQALFLFSVHQLYQKFLKPQNYWYAMVLLFLSAGVYLPMTRSLMPDLMVLSIGTFALWKWFSAEKSTQYLFSGLLLGTAAWVKYPALILFLLPLFSRKKGDFGWFLLGGAGIFCLGESWLWSMYGEVHFLEVLRRAPEIPRSSFGARGIGMVNRLGISLFPLSLLLLIQMKKNAWIIGGIGGLCSLLYAYHLGIEHRFLAFPFGFLGGVLLSSFRFNSIWSFWAMLVLLAVLIGHNYASPRYWVLIAFPLLLQEVKDIQLERRHWLITFPAAMVSFFLARTEFLQARAAAQLAEEIQHMTSAGAFTGEWTFRWKMEQLGYSFMADQQPKMVIWARNSAGGVDALEYTLFERKEGAEGLFSLVNFEHSVGYYAETLGYFPFWIGTEPLEVVEIWKKK